MNARMADTGGRRPAAVEASGRLRNRPPGNPTRVRSFAAAALEAERALEAPADELGRRRSEAAVDHHERAVLEDRLARHDALHGAEEEERERRRRRRDAEDAVLRLLLSNLAEELDPHRHGAEDHEGDKRRHAVLRRALRVVRDFELAPLGEHKVNHRVVLRRHRRRELLRVLLLDALLLQDVREARDFGRGVRLEQARLALALADEELEFRRRGEKVARAHRDGVCGGGGGG
jgi:hypothetical protein